MWEARGGGIAERGMGVLCAAELCSSFVEEVA
jgi:hypothetical protein